MIALTTSFSLLAALSTLAAVEGAAIPMPKAVRERVMQDLKEPFVAITNSKRDLFHNYHDNEDHLVDYTGLGISIAVRDGGSVHVKRDTQKFFTASGAASGSSSDIERRHSHDHDWYRHRGHWRHGGRGGRTVIVKGDNDNVHLKRDEDSGVAGRVDINKSGSGERVASLALVKANETYILDASDTNATTLYLVHAPAISPTANYTLVRLEIDMFDTDTSSTVRYCATFDASPPEPSPMTIELCQNATEASNEHKSQFFEWVKETNVIKPTWFSVSNDTSSDTQGAASIDEEETITDLDIRDDESDDSSESVDLVFVPAAPVAASVPQAAAAEDSSSKDSMSTVTVTVTVSASSTMSAEDVSTATFTDVSTATGSAISTASMSSDSDMPSSSVQNLQVIVATPSPSESASSDSMSASTTADVAASTTTSDAAPTTTMNAEDVAAGIASDSTSSDTSTLTDASSSSSNAQSTPLFVSQ